MKELFGSIYQNKRILITGHTGFKGSWLAYWLVEMGAKVLGFSKDVPPEPNHNNLISTDLIHIKGNINNYTHLQKVFDEFQPDIVFHLAAQALVRYSYKHPQETFETNVMGTVNVFEAAKRCKSVVAIVNVTSDKAYENLEIDVAYTENDRMGGYDPYSASKGCAELVVNSYRNSFFNLKNYKKNHNILLASARAGNVIGGGDWAEDRLIPDVIKASYIKQPAVIRNPGASRPWQHVLEPLSGYLLLGQKLLQGQTEFAEGWNFGPTENKVLTVGAVLQHMLNEWPDLSYVLQENEQQPHEATLLRLDCTKAKNQLKWTSVWDMNTAIQKTAAWYKNYYSLKKINTQEDLNNYIVDAKAKNLGWAKNNPINEL